MSSDLNYKPSSSVRSVLNPIVLLASGLKSASAAEADVQNEKFRMATAMHFILDVSTQAGTNPTLDVAIQAKVQDYYFNLVRFTQIVSADIPKRRLLHIHNAATMYGDNVELDLAANPAVSSGLANSYTDWIDTLRVKYTIGGTGGPSFTFGVTAIPIV